MASTSNRGNNFNSPQWQNGKTTFEKLNRIQDLFSSLGYDPIELPKIIVVGTQSSGKSSVLESLVSKSFLPRGPGIVTRSPLVLQMIRCPLDDDRRDDCDMEEWGEFLHNQDTRFDINDICEEIERQTAKQSGKNKGIGEQPISLKIYSPHVADLTLIDLPGITKVPVGDQPADIEESINNLIKKYIKNPLSIILAVVTANNDMSTNDSLKIAREVDPEGLRTLAVVTKLDLMDEETDARDILAGKVIPVKLGIIGVVNRSQKEINKNVSVQEARRKEAEFFRTHYKDLASTCGTPYLAKTLHELFISHIKTCLPEIMVRIERETEYCEDILSTYGKPIDDYKAYLSEVIPEFAFKYRTVLNRAWSSSQVMGGAKIRRIFEVTLKEDLLAIDPIQEYTWDQVLITIRNANGTTPSFFVSETAFENLVKPVIFKLKKPCLNVAELVRQEMLSVFDEVVPKEISCFPLLKQEALQLFTRNIEAYMSKTKEMITDLVSMEATHISYDKLESLKKSVVLRLLTLEESELQEEVTSFQLNSWVASTINDSEEVLKSSSYEGFSDHAERTVLTSVDEWKQLLIIDRLIFYYFGLVRDAVHDATCKIIITFLVSSFQKSVETNLITHFHNDEVNWGDYFDESETIRKDRKEATEKLEVLQAARQILREL